LSFVTTMKQAAEKQIHFLRTTAIGGLLFLLPLIVLGALVGQVAPIVLAGAAALGGFLPGFLKTPNGLALLILLTLVILLLLCFAAGLLAQWSWGKRLTEAFEKNVVWLFPRYAILKDQMADSIGGDHTRPQMRPVLVRFDDYMQIAFETERDTDSGRVAVYLPGSPDPWRGRVVLVDAERVESLHQEFGRAVAVCEQLGRGSAALANDAPASDAPASDALATDALATDALATDTQ
jgi:uncharacterized membrane protein